MDRDILYPCPACGFEVFDEPPGSYEICCLCGWEDDEVQLRFPLMQGGANKDCLFERQQRILKSLPPDLVLYEGKHRCTDWRPLMQEDCGDSTKIPRNGMEYFEASGAQESKYYWRAS